MLRPLPAQTDASLTRRQHTTAQPLYSSFFDYSSIALVEVKDLSFGIIHPINKICT